MPVHTLPEPAVRRLDTHPRVSAESIKLQQQVYDHQGNVGQGVTPILVFDAWEHAFYLRYRNQKVDFFEAM